MTKLERSILRAVARAQARHLVTTGNYWLWHGPEAFLSTYVGSAICGAKQYVYLEGSPTKLRADQEPKRGPKPKNRYKRFDIVVWWRTTNLERAVIEVKRAWAIDPIRKDVSKIRAYLRQSSTSARCGYVIYYTESQDGRIRPTDSEAVIRRRFASAATLTKVRLVGYKISKLAEDDWRWGVALYKVGR